MCICDFKFFVCSLLYIYIAGLFSLVHVLFDIMFVYCRTPMKTALNADGIILFKNMLNK